MHRTGRSAPIASSRLRRYSVRSHSAALGILVTGKITFVDITSSSTYKGTIKVSGSAAVAGTLKFAKTGKVTGTLGGRRVSGRY